MVNDKSLEPETVECLLDQLAFDDPHPLRALSTALTLTDKVGQISDAAGITPLIVIPTHDMDHTLFRKYSGQQSIHDA
jgi:hypothetical protein